MILAQSALVAEIRQDGFVGLLVRHEDLVPVLQGLRRALELGSRHLGIAAPAYEEPAEGERLVEAEIGLNVPVHDPRNSGQSGRRVPAQSLAAERCDQALLALYPIQVSPGRLSIASVEERLGAV